MVCYSVSPSRSLPSVELEEVVVELELDAFGLPFFRDTRADRFFFRLCFGGFGDVDRLSCEPRKRRVEMATGSDG